MLMAEEKSTQSSTNNAAATGSTAGRNAVYGAIGAAGDHILQSVPSVSVDYTSYIGPPKTTAGGNVAPGEGGLGTKYKSAIKSQGLTYSGVQSDVLDYTGAIGNVAEKAHAAKLTAADELSKLAATNSLCRSSSEEFTDDEKKRMGEQLFRAVCEMRRNGKVLGKVYAVSRCGKVWFNSGFNELNNTQN
jgi:hypothetical protein